VNLLPLFLVSLAAVGIETALTRYFAVASWSDYGYWVISIVMAGFAFSGVTLALARDAFARRSGVLFAALPALLTLSAALGYGFTIRNPFNPLQLQNQVTYLPQLGNIALYYAALLPFFFLAGLFISLCFVCNTGRIGRVYAADLTGAGCGSILVLGLMYVCSPFALIPALLPALALAGCFAPHYRKQAIAAAGISLLLAEALLALGPQASISQYKPLYPPLHTPGAHVLAEAFSPHGDYLLLDDFTERVNTDISNDAGMLGYADPPRSFGLYRDGIRIASLPMPGKINTGYAPGALDALPYALRPHARILLTGASGGFRISEVLALGAAQVTALEPEPLLYAALRRGLAASPAFPVGARVRLSPLSPVAAAQADGPYDIIDLSGDFMDAAPANVNGFTAEAFTAYLRALRPGGIISIPVSIEDFPVYALRMLSTARAALADADPLAQVIVYRSAWNARILVSNAPFTNLDISRLRKWCDDRSFDVSYYQGIDIAAARNDLYNDLPAVSFDAGTITSYGPDDSIADEAEQVLLGQPTISFRAFNLAPVTNDRPVFYAVLRLTDLSVLLARLQILPQAEIGALVNLAVLAQAILIAALVLLAPLVSPRIARPGGAGLLRPIVYFPALAIGFLFIEIFAIEKASAFLDDRAAGFALVLSFMLIFSGLGSLSSSRFAGRPQRGVALAWLVITAWALAVLALVPAAMLAGDGLPYVLRCVLVVLSIAPVSFAMGLPFPLGLGVVSGGSFLPWAWGLNGAFSVVATPLAALVARNSGLHIVLTAAVLLYGLAAILFPASRRQMFWLTSSPAVE
jgi:SAM-dependent methyltransferase